MESDSQAGRQQIFDEIRALFEGGNSIGEIARKLGLGRRRVERWVRRIDVPDRNAMASTPSSPAYFGVLAGLISRKALSSRTPPVSH
jgi:transposase-like protein